MESDIFPLSPEDARVLGCLIEKAMTTPDQYPMSLNGVRVACNQVSNRNPIVDYDETTVARTLRSLADRGLTKFVHRAGDRVVKYIHGASEAIGLADNELALVAVLLLRGTQTPGELRQRTSRYVSFTGLPQVETTLEGLRRHDPPLVEELPRKPGQKEHRWRQLMTPEAAWDPTEPPGSAILEDQAAAAAPPPDDEVTALRAELDELRGRFERLLAALGVDEI